MLENTAGGNFILSILLANNERQNEIWAGLGYVDGKDRRHDTQTCSCEGCEWIEELIEVVLMDEDSPNNMLTPEEHISLFNKSKLLDEKSSTEELIAKRQLLKRAIAVLRTKVQSKTVILNDRRSKATREEKAAIAAADKLYSPALRPDEKASDAEIKTMVAINENPKLKAFLKALPMGAYKATISTIKQLGIDGYYDMFPSLKPENHKPQPSNESEE